MACFIMVKLMKDLVITMKSSWFTTGKMSLALDAVNPFAGLSSQLEAPTIARRVSAPDKRIDAGLAHR